MRQTCEIRRLSELSGVEKYRDGIDAVFFQSSNTQSFADATARGQFRERWLGRYLTHDPEWAFLALTADAAVAGYLVGSITDPATADRFADLAYFKAFVRETARFPAHLHVNLLEPYRNAGIGSRLIETFVAALPPNIPGVHVITGARARNIVFYNRNGFSEVARWGDGPGEVVFLGRDLK